MGKHYNKHKFSSYEKCSNYEREKLNQGYKRLKTYDDFYLYGKYDFGGKLLYRECFSRFDIDGEPPHPRVSNPYWSVLRGR